MKLSILIKQKALIVAFRRAGFPKVSQVTPLGAMKDTQGATNSKGARGGPWAVKEPQGAMRSYFKTYTRYSWVADEKQKKKVSGLFFGSLQTYIRFLWDEEQKKRS